MQPSRQTEQKELRRPQTLRARQLRNRPTEPEIVMWQFLRARRLAGFRFNRQVSIGPFICDFVCRSQRLVVEIDGASHLESREYDIRRTQFLASRGYRMIRFWNSDVMANPEGVADQILRHLNQPPSPSPSRKRKGSEENPAGAGSAC